MASTFPLILAALACLALYLASPNQRWLARAWSARPARVLAAMLWLTSLTLAVQAMQAVAAVFTLGVWSMLLLTLFPYLGAWRTPQRER